MPWVPLGVFRTLPANPESDPHGLCFGPQRILPFGESTRFALISAGPPGHYADRLVDHLRDEARPIRMWTGGSEVPATRHYRYLFGLDERLGPFGQKFCEYCGTLLEYVPLFKNPPGNQPQREDELACPGCRWWVHIWAKAYREGDAFRTIAHEAVVHAFDYADSEQPLTALRNKIAKTQIDLRDVSPRDLELLVGSVFRDFYEAEVKHVGGTADGGIDLLIVEGNRPIAIQVKRRKHRSTEAPAVIRDLIGALTLEGLHRGAVVTTAERFGPQSHQNVENPLLERAGYEIDLYALDALLELFQAVDPRDRPWLESAQPHHLSPKDREIVQARADKASPAAGSSGTVGFTIPDLRSD